MKVFMRWLPDTVPVGTTVLSVSGVNFTRQRLELPETVWKLTLRGVRNVVVSAPNLTVLKVEHCVNVILECLPETIRCGPELPHSASFEDHEILFSVPACYTDGETVRWDRIPPFSTWTYVPVEARNL